MMNRVAGAKGGRKNAAKEVEGQGGRIGRDAVSEYVRLGPSWRAYP